MIDVVTTALIEDLKSRVNKRRDIAYVPTSRTITAPFDCLLIVRAMAAGGSGAKSAAGYPSGGNAGDVAIKVLKVDAGTSIVVAIGAGGVAQTTANSNGNTGSTTTITVGAWTGTLYGGRGGVQGTANAQPSANQNPVGFDSYWKGGLGGGASGASSAGGGGSAPLLEGTAAGFAGGFGVGSAAGGGAGVGGNGGNGNTGGSYFGAGGGSGGPGGTASAGGNGAGGLNLSGEKTTAAALASGDYCRLKINCSGGGGIGPSGNVVGNNGGPGGGGSGGGAGGSSGFGAGSGGFVGNPGNPGETGPGGGGGAGAGTGAGSGVVSSAPGGNAFVTCEFLEI